MSFGQVLQTLYFMKNILLYLLAASFVFFASCKDDESDDPIDFDYHAHIHLPNTDDKQIGDLLEIEVDFESHTGETVHHIKVRIYNKVDNTEIYNKPSDAHIHEEDGDYTFSDTFELSNANGVEADTDWVLEAKVWGHEAGVAEDISTVEFHVNP